MAFQKLREMLAGWLPANEKEAGQEKNPQASLPWMFLLVFALVKIWMIGDLEITAVVGRVDDTLYLQLAEKWFWGMPYDDISLVRLPVFPLWLALVQQTGVPLRIATEIVQIAAAAMLAGSMVRVGFGRLLAASLYLVLVFNPYSFHVDSRALPDVLYAPLLMSTTACLITMLGAAPPLLRWRTVLVAGLNLALLWNCRDENFLAAAGYGGMLLLYSFLHLRTPANRVNLGKSAAFKLALPLFLALAMDYSIRLTNYAVYGVFCRTENNSAYADAYRALFRVKPDRTIQYFSVPRETRAQIYAVSPALRSISNEIEKGAAGTWGKSYGRKYGQPDDIPSGQLVWVLRWAAGKAGKHPNAPEAQAFYKKMAREINGAIDKGKLPGRPLLPSFLDPATFQHLDKLPASFHRVFGSLLYDLIEPPRDDLPLKNYTGKKELRPLFDSIANRRVALTYSPRTIKVSGEVLVAGSILSSVDLLDDTLAVIGKFRLQNTGAPGQKFNFVCEVDAATPFDTGYLRFWDAANLQMLLPVSPARDWYPGKLPAGWNLTLDKIEADSKPVETSQFTVRAGLLQVFRASDLPIYGLAALGMGLALIFWKMRIFSQAQTSALLLMAFIGLSRLGFWTLVDLTMFYCYSPRYSFPAQQVLWAVILPLAAVPFCLLWRLIQRKR